MFCPKCGHKQASDSTRFCSRCGFSLDIVAGLVTNNDQYLQRERREVEGLGFMTATIALLSTFLLVFGLITLPHMIGPVFLKVWLLFMLVSLTVGGFGVINLARSGFFRKLKERQTRLVLMKLTKEQQALPEKSADTSSNLAASGVITPGSVTERTTRELQSIPKDDQN